jgi:hypothetical protein
MKYALKDTIRWVERWSPIEQEWHRTLQTLTIISHINNETQQGTFEDIWVDVPIVKEED